MPVLNKLHRGIACLIALSTVITGCNSLAVEPPTLTPTYALSGPTLEPSATVLNVLPTEMPPDFVGPGQSIPEAAAVPFGSQIRPIVLTPDAEQLRRGIQPVTIVLSDGTVVQGELYENAPVQLEQGLVQPRLPGVMLVGTPRDAWVNLPFQLRDAGYTVFVIDLGVDASSEDFVLALTAFSEVPSVNSGLMAAVGLDDSADLVLIGCAVETMCDTVILISPRSAETLTNVMTDYNPRPMMVIASQGNEDAYNAGLALRDASVGSFSLQEFPGTMGGLEIIRNQSDLANIIRDWVIRFLVE